MPLQIIRQNIINLHVDAIVNPTDPYFSGSGGTDRLIHAAAGALLSGACSQFGTCKVGKARVTSGYLLPCRYVIHAIVPVWRGGEHSERELLVSCYRNSLRIARLLHCKTLAFPLLASGSNGFPKELALKIAIDTITEFLLREEMTVYLVLFDKAAYQISKKLFTDIAAYIDETYVKEHTAGESEPLRHPREMVYGAPTAKDAPLPPAMAASTHRPPQTLEEALGQIDESFTEMLLRKIDESGMTDAEVYKKANIDRKLFSKIRKDRLYRPSKPTAIAFAIALELSPAETHDLLQKAGYALSHSNPFDIIIEFFITRGNYNIFEINEALFAFDQSLLGA